MILCGLSGGSLAIDTKRLLNRLARIAGQAAGISRMIEQNRDCVDTLTQLRAVRAAIRKVELEILREQIDDLVRSAMSEPKSNRRSKTDEIILLIEKAAK